MNSTESRIAVIIPAYNEEKTIEEVLTGFHQHIPEAEFWVIDNCSSDRTNVIATETLNRLGAKGGVLEEPRKGKSNACRMGFRLVNADVYVMVDADATYPAEAVRDLVAPILQGKADMVVGDRLTNGSYYRSKVRRFHGLGNWLVCYLLRLFFGTRIKDAMSGYRAFTEEYIKLYPILQSGFELETEMSIHAICYGYRILEIPVDYVERPEGSSSKLRTFSDGFRVLKLMIRLLKNYRPIHFFGSLAAISACLGVFVGLTALTQFYELGYVVGVASAILASSLCIIALLLALVGVMMDTITSFQRSDYEMRRNTFSGRSSEKRK